MEMVDVLSGYDKALARMTELVEKGEVLEEFTPGTMADLQTNLQNSGGR